MEEGRMSPLHVRKRSGKLGIERAELVTSCLKQ